MISTKMTEKSYYLWNTNWKYLQQYNKGSDEINEDTKYSCNDGEENKTANDINDEENGSEIFDVARKEHANYSETCDGSEENKKDDELADDRNEEQNYSERCHYGVWNLCWRSSWSKSDKYKSFSK